MKFDPPAEGIQVFVPDETFWPEFERWKAGLEKERYPGTVEVCGMDYHPQHNMTVFYWRIEPFKLRLA